MNSNVQQFIYEQGEPLRLDKFLAEKRNRFFTRSITEPHH